MMSTIWISNFKLNSHYSPLPLITAPLEAARGSGQGSQTPAGPGGARPPNAFWCNSQPKICKSVKVLPACTKRLCMQHLMTFPECRFCPSCRPKFLDLVGPGLLALQSAESGHHLLHSWSQIFGRLFVKRFALCYQTVQLSRLSSPVLSCPVCLYVTLVNFVVDEMNTKHFAFQFGNIDMIGIEYTKRIYVHDGSCVVTSNTFQQHF